MIEQILGKSDIHRLALFSREEVSWLEERIFRRKRKAGMEWAVKRVLDSKRGVERGWRPPTQINFEGRHEVSLNRLDEDVGREILDRLKPKPADPAEE